VPVIGAIAPVLAVDVVGLAVAGGDTAAAVSTLTVVVSAGFFSPPAQAANATAPNATAKFFNLMLFGLLEPC